MLFELIVAFSIETSFYFMYLCSRVDSALWYLCHKTPLKTELKSPAVEFSLKFPHSWLAENLFITWYSWFHSWLLNERFSCEHWFLWLRKKGVFLVSLCVSVWLILWIVLFLVPEIFYLYLLNSTDLHGSTMYSILSQIQT